MSHLPAARYLQRLVQDPPKLPCPRLSNFLDRVSREYPKVFYKPLFSCANATKDSTVVKQLCVLNALVKVVSDFWVRDPQMTLVALMDEAASAAMKGKAKEGKVSWSKARIGQSVLLIELTEHIRSVRDSRDPAAVSPCSFALTIF